MGQIGGEEGWNFGRYCQVRWFMGVGVAGTGWIVR